MNLNRAASGTGCSPFRCSAAPAGLAYNYPTLAKPRFARALSAAAQLADGYNNGHLAVAIQASAANCKTDLFRVINRDTKRSPKLLLPLSLSVLVVNFSCQATI
jgi:hypothetical protein